MAANADGDDAVSWTQQFDHRAYVAVRQRGGTWHRFPMGTTGFGAQPRWVSTPTAT